MMKSKKTSESWVIPFDAPGAQELNLVGGKGKSLAELVSHGLQVPSGFCVSTSAFCAFLQSVPNASSSLDAMSDIEPDNTEQIRQAAAAFRECLVDVQLPRDVENAILAAHIDLGASKRYAVRSSATTEDLEGASFAGQHDTYLEVVGEKALLGRIKDCWLSLYTDRAVAYRRQQSIPERIAVMSVVVQQMAEAEVAGVLFTADPLTGRRDVCTLDASYGLGEAVVSGIVSPDAYTVEKSTGAVISHHVGSKKLEIIPRAEGGTESIEVSPKRQAARALTDAQAETVAALGVTVEDLKGEPQDIEWCLKGDQVYLLQARPITSLYPMPQPQQAWEVPRVYVCMGHQQANPAAWSPMANSLFACIPPFGKKLGVGRSAFMVPVGHRLYIDLTAPMLVSPFRSVIPHALKQLSPAIGERLALVVEREDYVAARDGASLSLWSAIKYGAPIVPKLISWLFFRRPEGVAAHWQHFLATRAAELERDLKGAGGAAQTLRAAQNVFAKVGEEIMVSMAGPVLFPGMLLFNVLKYLMANRVPEGTVERLTQGLDGNIATQMNLELGDLADHVRSVPGLASALAEVEPRLAIESVRAHPGGEQFGLLWEAFLGKWGHRSMGEMDIAVPRWSDDPSSLIRSLLGMLDASEAGEHRRRFEAARADAELARRLLMEAAGRGPMGWLRSKLVRFMIRRIRAYMAMREHHKFAVISDLGKLRTAILRVADEAVEDGNLVSLESVWMLGHDELIEAFESEGPLREVAWENLRRLAVERRMDHERFAKMFPPAVLLSTGEIPPMPVMHENLPVGALGGVPVSAGVVEGIARVLKDPAQETLLAGEILVAPFTDAAWTTLFVHAGGVVLEAGGAMSHGSVVAREFALPAVVGVEGATIAIKTGQRIRVDGDKGIVTPLNEPTRDEASAEVKDL